MHCGYLKFALHHRNLGLASAFVGLISITYLITLSLAKEISSFWKKNLEKVLNFASKNLCEYLFLYLFIPTARHVFRVSSVDAEGGHSHTLQAPNEEEKKQWLNAIRSVIPSPENYKTYL